MPDDTTKTPDSKESSPQPGAAAPPPKRGFFRRHWIGTTVAALILLPAFAFTVWAGVALSFSYSEGTRTGFVQKLSHKGWVCKTWEGEMAMTAQPGVAPVLFNFTVRSDSIANEITRLEGKQVTLTYAEHKGVPSSCFGETGHYVEGVSAVGR
jgi:hypothetical protein